MMAMRATALIVSLMAFQFAVAESASDFSAHVMRAAGFVFSAKRLMERVTLVCGDDAPALSDSWMKRNSAQVSKATLLFDRALAEVEKLDSEVEVEKFRAEQAQTIDDKAAAFGAEIAAEPPASRHKTCRRFISEVDEGRWDIKRLDASVYSFIQSAH